MALLTVGTAAPDIKLMNLTGAAITLADLKGKKAAVVIFPEVNVEPARTRGVQGIYTKYREQVEIIAIQRSVPSVPMAKVFLQQMAITFPILLDDKGEVHKAYGVEKPTVAYFVDKNGVIVGVGEMIGQKADASVLEQGIKQYLVKS